MNHKPLSHLIAAARKAYAPPSLRVLPQPPLGFSTRLAARWAQARGPMGWGDLWERLSWWGASASVAVCLVAFAHQAMAPEPNPFDLLLEVQAVEMEIP
jgi:hypothetical protein